MLKCKLYYSNEFANRICYLHVHFQGVISLCVLITRTLTNVHVFFFPRPRWRHSWPQHISETRFNQKIGNCEISASARPIDLKFSPVVHPDKRWRSKNFKVGHSSGLYYAGRSVSYEKCLHAGIYKWHWIQLWTKSTS